MSLEDEKVPRCLMIGSDGLNIISSALYPYRKFVTNLVPDSAQRTKILGRVVSLEARIEEYLKNNKENKWGYYFYTSGEELILIYDAVSLFIISIRYLVPESAERNKVIDGYRQLLKLLTQLIEAQEDTKGHLN